MKIENTGIDNKVVDILALNKIMGQHAFILGESWDYDRVTYDYKINSQEKNVTYFIRILGEALEGDVDTKTAVIKLKTPLLGKHYYPFGVEYGEDENFPKNLVERVNKIVTTLNGDLERITQ